MKYKIDFDPNHLQFVVNVLQQTPLRHMDVDPVLAEIQRQVDEQNAARDDKGAEKTTADK